MIVWAVCGIVIGGALSSRLGIGSLALFLLAGLVLPLLALVVLRRADFDTVATCATFWVAAQVGYFLTKLWTSAAGDDLTA